MSEVQFIGGAPTPDDRLNDHSLYFNREISWLAFNRRVLEEALDPSWPLLERVKFLSIFHSNLDEFFMIRVSGLHEQLEASVTERSADGLSAPEQLRMIREIVHRDAGLAMQTLRDDLQPKLAEAGVRILAWDDVDPERRRELSAYFESVVFPVLTPLAFDPAHPFPFVSNLSLSLAVELTDKKEKRPAFARVKVPASLGRFVPVPGAPGKTLEFVLLEKLVEANLDRLFPGMQILGASAFRVTRDADIEIREDEAGDLLDSVAENVRRRRFGAAIRLEVEERCPETVRELLRGELELEPEDVYAVDGPLGAADLISVLKLDLPQLKDVPYLPSARTIFDPPANLFDTIRKGDILLHQPYDSFDPVLRFLEEAAADKDVLAIKMTLYRTGTDSPIVAALARAAENGKQVAVLVELKARFDEENNIDWARSLERAGVHVVYGVEGLKTHAKIALVVRREGNDDPALRPRRHGQLQPGHRAHLHGPRPLHGAGRHRRRRLGALQLPDRLLEEDEVPQADGGPLAAPRQGARPDRPRSGEGPRGQARVDRRQDERARGPGRHPRALPRVPGGRPDRARRPRHLLPAAGRSRRVRGTSASRASWGASSSTAAPSPSVSARRKRSTSRAPTGCRATSTPASS